MNSTLATAAAFNLICSGHSLTYGVKDGEPVETRGVFKSVYHVDLTKMLWCTGSCQESRPIQIANDIEIWLQRSLGVPGASTYFNQNTKQFLNSAKGKAFMDTQVGTCTKVDFTGLPD